MGELVVVVMAGGMAKRMGGVEKPLVKVCGKPMIEHVLVTASNLSRKLYVAVSPNTPLTERWCLENGYPVIATSGKSYPEDLKEALSIANPPILFLPADTPFITRSVLEEFVEKALELKESVITLLVDRTKCFPEHLWGSEPRSPTGISLLKGYDWSWNSVVMCRFPDLLDIDTWFELEYAERLCS